MLCNHVVLLVATLLISSCSAIGNLWDEDKEKASGERIPAFSDVKTETSNTKVEDVKQENFPEEMHNRNWHTSNVSDSLLMGNLHLKQDLKPLHKWSIRGDYHFSSLSVPIIVNGNFIASDSANNIVAFDVSTGKEKWQNTLLHDNKSQKYFFMGGKGTSTTNLYFEENIIYATSLNKIIAIDVESGETLWHKDFKDIIAKTPSAYDGKVFVQTVKDNIYALDTKSGDAVWVAHGFSEAVDLIDAKGFSIDDGILVSTNSLGEVIAFDADTGQEIWAHNTLKHNSVSSVDGFKCSVVINDGKVYTCTSDERLIALELKTGNPVFDTDVGTVYGKSFWIAGDVVYLVSEKNLLVALSKHDGRRKWTKELDSLGAGESKLVLWSTPIVAGNAVVLVSSEGKLFKFNSMSGETLQEMEIERKVYLPPLVANGEMYIVSSNGKITLYSSGK